jgi:hypothetical protein
VGFAWLQVRRQYPQQNPWQADGSHPSLQGIYLAACVFYSVIFKQSPGGYRSLPACRKKRQRYYKNSRPARF